MSTTLADSLAGPDLPQQSRPDGFPGRLAAAPTVRLLPGGHGPSGERGRDARLPRHRLGATAEFWRADRAPQTKRAYGESRASAPRPGRS